MRARKCEPDSITFACMIQAYDTQGMTEAGKILENMMITAKDSSGTLQFPQPFLLCKFYVWVLFCLMEKCPAYYAFLGI